MAEWWTVDLLDSSDYQLAELGRVRSGSLEWSTFRAVQGSGSLELTNDPTVEPRWLSDRVKVWHHVDETRSPFGVWMVTKPGEQVDGPVTRMTLGLVDKTQLLNQPVGRWLTYAAGTAVVATVVGIIASRGEERANVEPSAETLRAPATFEPQDTWLTVVNKLLEAIGYGSLWANLDGVLTSGPYIAPDARGLALTYGPGAAKMRPGYGDEMDLSEIPNIVFVYSPGDDTAAGLIGRASNDNPTDPLSTVNRPEVVFTEQADATSQAAVDAIAVKRLGEKQQVTRRATITHPLDGTRLNDVVAHPAGFVGAIVQRTITLGVGAVVEDSVRRIHTAGEELPWI